MNKKFAIFCLVFSSLTALASESVVNGCAHEAFSAAQAIARLNGSEEIRIATRTIVAGRETEKGLLFTYRFNPQSNGSVELENMYSVDVVKNGNNCKVISVALENN